MSVQTVNKITVNLINGVIEHSGSYKDDWGGKREFDSFKIKEVINSRVYITVIKDSIKRATIIKQMKFVDGNILISFGKSKVKIGTYEEV